MTRRARGRVRHGDALHASQSPPRIANQLSRRPPAPSPAWLGDVGALVAARRPAHSDGTRRTAADVERRSDARLAGLALHDRELGATRLEPSARTTDEEPLVVRDAVDELFDSYEWSVDAVVRLSRPHDALGILGHSSEARVFRLRQNRYRERANVVARFLAVEERCRGEERE